jgi:hypothetical protein
MSETKTAKELFAEFDKAIAECIVVPNEILPEQYRDERTDGVTLANIQKRIDYLDGVSDAEEEKYEKDLRIAVYREAIDKGQEIEYLPKKGWRP